VLLTTLASGLSSGIKNSTTLAESQKAQIGTSLAANAANVELGGVSKQTDQNFSVEQKNELNSIVKQASTNGSRQAILYTGGFIFIGFLLSFMLPNVKDLDRSTRTAPTSGH
jgi:predicted PurR-regulated permease PerM